MTAPIAAPIVRLMCEVLQDGWFRVNEATGVPREVPNDR